LVESDDPRLNLMAKYNMYVEGNFFDGVCHYSFESHGFDNNGWSKKQFFLMRSFVMMAMSLEQEGYTLETVEGPFAKDRLRS
jgi:hypothetical protein